MAPHPLATLRFEGCRIPAARLLGSPGEGFKIAMRTLDIFRASVAAAALGFARRALDEATAHARTRKMFGGVLGDQQLTQAALGDMAAGVDASALSPIGRLRRDVQKASTTREAAMAKMVATETAQAVIDRAVQMFGGAAFAPARWSSSSTARYARCASMKARPKSRNSLSDATS